MKYFYCAKVTKYGLFGSSSFLVNGTFMYDGESDDLIHYAEGRVIIDHKSLVLGLSIDIVSLNKI